ncbi:hypothetical protein ACLKA7_007847 [Drosophila subpalustris]
MFARRPGGPLLSARNEYTERKDGGVTCWMVVPKVNISEADNRKGGDLINCKDINLSLASRAALGVVFKSPVMQISVIL